MIKGMLIAMVAFLMGQFSISTAYDPADLERNALSFILQSNYEGCVLGMHGVCIGKNLKECDTDVVHSACLSATKARTKEIEQMWHDKAWKLKEK